MGIKIRKLRIGGGEKSISLLVAFSLAYYPLVYAFNEIVNRYIQQGAWWDSALCLGLYLVAVVMAIPLIVRRQTLFTLISFLTITILFLVTIVSGSDGAVYAASNIKIYFLTFFPFIFIGLAIRDFEDLDKTLNIITRIVICASVIWIAIIVFNVNRGIRVAYMGISYYVLPSCLLRTYYYFRDKGYANFIWMIISLLCHVIWGTRGPVLFAFLFVALCVLWNNKNKKRTAVKFVILFSVVTVVYINFFKILNWANNIFISMGLKNGGIIRLLTGTDITDGRVDLIKQALPYINEHFVFGGGIYCDRFLLNGYVHSLPIELICDFGILGGSLLFLFLLCYIIKTVFEIREFNDFRWAILWIAIIVGFAKLFLSGSYLEEPYFYFLLGLLANKFMFKNKQVVSEDVVEDNNEESNEETNNESIVAM